MNPRMISFVVVALLLMGFPAYVFIKESVTGGVVNRGDYLEVNLKAMSSFEIDQVHGAQNDVPEKWRNLSGKKVVLEGEMWAPNSASAEVNDFELVYSVAKCCFSGPPKIQHFVLAKSRSGGPMPNLSGVGLIRVTGTLNVQVEQDAGKIGRIFSLVVDKLEPL